MSLISIRTQIVSLLDNIKVAAGFNAVYYDAPTSINVTPAVAVILGGFSEEIGSNAGNILNCTYTIRVMVEKKESDFNDVEQTSKVLNITDAILAEFRKKENTTLSGASYSMMTANGSPLQIGELEQINVFYVNIELAVKEYNSIC